MRQREQENKTIRHPGNCSRNLTNQTEVVDLGQPRHGPGLVEEVVELHGFTQGELRHAGRDGPGTNQNKEPQDVVIVQRNPNINKWACCLHWGSFFCLTASCCQATRNSLSLVAGDDATRKSQIQI